MSELTQAICKYLGSPESGKADYTDNILEELADVMVLWQQIIYLLGVEADKKIRDIAYSKVNRTLERMGSKTNTDKELSAMTISPSDIRIPLIEVKDLHSKKTHIVGTDIHDSLIIHDGKICYHNYKRFKKRSGGVNMKFNYGNKVKDTTNGYCGVVTGYCHYYGMHEDQYLVENLDSTGRPITQWVDDKRLIREDWND